MKFSKSLTSAREETLPELRDKFLAYKELKKQLNLIFPHDNNNNNNNTANKTDGDEAPVTKRRRLEQQEEEDGGGAVAIDFVRVLDDEMERFNSIILDKEEDFVIKWKELQDRVEEAKNSHEELMRVGREMVDFHGEMVLLENYSALNYTGLVKILKKYDKKSGELVRLAFIRKIMQQPFFNTEVLNQLVKECETMLDQLFTRNESPISCETTSERSEESDRKFSTKSMEHQLRFRKEFGENESMDSMYMKLTLAALRALKEIRSGSSTVNMFSLPPLQIKINAVEEDLKKVPLLEQLAK